MGWSFILAESLFLLYLWLCRQEQAEVAHYLRLRELTLGVEGVQASLLTPFLFVNVLLVVALWAAQRGTRLEPTSFARVMAATSLLEAIVVAALSWNIYRLASAYPALEVVEILIRTPTGGYEKLVQ